MPNIQTKNFTHPSYPFVKDGYEFEFATIFDKNRSLIKVKKDKKEFFLEVATVTYIKEANHFLLIN